MEGLILTVSIIGLAAIIAGIVIVILQNKKMTEFSVGMKNVAESFGNSLDSVLKSNNNLVKNLENHGKQLSEMPKNFSEEVKTGLKPTEKELAKSAKTFAELLEQMPNAEKLPDWLVQLTKSIDPLNKIVETSEKHYEEYVKVLQLIYDINKLTAKERDNYGSLYEKTVKGLGEWTASQSNMSSEFKNMVQNGLAALTNVSQNTQSSYDKINEFIQRTENVFIGLDKDLPRTTQNMNKMSEDLREATLQFKEISSQLKSTSENLNTAVQRFEMSAGQVLSKHKTLQVGVIIVAAISVGSLVLNFVI